jgi:hypothetical protein
MLGRFIKFINYMAITEMYPSTDINKEDYSSEESNKGLGWPPLESVELESFNSEFKSLDTYAKNINPEEIKRLKKEYQIDFYSAQSSEVFCHQLEDTIVDKINELKNCYKDLDYNTDRLQDRSNVEEETVVYQEGQNLVEEIKKLVNDYEQYIDAISPEVANIYDIPEEFQFSKYGPSFNVKETLDYIEKVDVGFGQVKDEDESYSEYDNQQLDKKPLHSFGVIRQKDSETKEVRYTLFRKNEFTKDDQAENSLVATDQDGWESESNFLTWYKDKGLKYFKNNPAGQLKLLAQLFKMYDLPEFNVGKIDFHSSIKAIRDIIQKKHDTFSNPDSSVYIKQRKFLAKQIEMCTHLSNYLEYAHQTNQLKRLEKKDNPDYVKAQ